MSRTYRRKNTRYYRGYFTDFEHFVSEYIWDGYRIVGRKRYAKDSKEYAKGLAKFHSDACTSRMMEPGPSWFRNLYSDRPLRRQAKNEIRKFIRSVPVFYNYYGEELEFLQSMYECYEPNILSKGKLPYWT